MTKLSAIHKYLISTGLTIEAAILASLIKTAVPLEGIFELPYDNPEDAPPSRSAKPDKRTRRYTEDQNRYRSDEYKKEQDEEYQAQWYGSMSALGDSVILIPFDDDKLSDDVVFCLADIFGVRATSYEGIKNKASMMEFGNSKRGDLDKLKSRFPALWAQIEALLDSKNLEESDAVYVLYNQDSDRQGISRDVKYFTHDLGHAAFDFDEDYEFRSIVTGFISEMIRLYKREEDGDDDENPTLISAYDEFYGERNVEDEMFEKEIESFFDGIFSSEGDYLGDIFSLAMSGDLSVDAPTRLWLGNEDYQLILPEDKDKAAVLVASVEKSITDYMNNKGRGPLHYDLGYVLLHDL